MLRKLRIRQKNGFFYIKKRVTHPSCYLTSIVDKTHHGPVTDPFSVQLWQYFSYEEVVLVSK